MQVNNDNGSDKNFAETLKELSVTLERDIEGKRENLNAVKRVMELIGVSAPCATNGTEVAPSPGGAANGTGIAPQTGGKSQSLILPGALQAYYDAQLYSRVPGYVHAWYKDIGAHVKKGDLLATIDTPELDQQITQARRVSP